ncbi:AsmA-like C-terminal region-containing protein [Magnetospirillum sp. SS-4]|uniref:AsmA family protein n=1 Tax=Magnetospirillum sp. SS-4 TaxID=2681465 RepID=UPI001384B922|nr:AsmA-like C-terminal region-containing protein [Magnetospirillum sp. SS-4]CAA7625186.1 conserved exported hypothetical protein [Magnetospirillum sp. SS-4]
MRAIAATAAAVMALPVLAVAVPALMDWSRLRPEVEAAASAALGRAVTISGPISARLLPSPAATLDGLAMDGASAGRLTIAVKLLPLLAGRREIERLSLSDGRIGPVDGVEASLAPDGAMTARGRLPLPNGDVAELAFDGFTDLRRGEGMLRLTSARLSAAGAMTLTPDELSLPEVTMTVGASAARASLIASLGHAPMVVDATLAADGIDLDAAIGAEPPRPGPTPSAAPANVPPTTPVSSEPAGFALPAGVTVNLSASVGRLRWRGVTLEAVEIAGLLDNGRFDIAHAKARGAGPVQAELSGTLVARDGRPAFDGILKAAAPPPRRLRLDSPVTLAGERIALPRLVLTVDDTRILGDATITIGPRPVITANLSGKGISASLTGRPEDDGLILDSIRAGTGDVAVTGGGRLILTGLPRLEADIASPAVALAPYLPAWGKAIRLTDIRARVILSDGQASVERFDGRMLDGRISGAGRANESGAAVTLLVSGADIAGLGLSAGGLKASKGRLDGEARLSARWTDPLASLNGDGRMEVRDGVVDGFDLAAINGQMSRLENIGSLLALVQTGLSGGQSRVSSLSAPFTIANGVVDSRDIKMVAEGGGATGTAVLDLPKDRIDARLAFRLSAPDTPPLGLRLEGRLGSPGKTIDINALQRHLVERGLGRALKGKGGGLIESLLGIKPRQNRE